MSYSPLNLQSRAEVFPAHDILLNSNEKAWKLKPINENIIWYRTKRDIGRYTADFYQTNIDLNTSRILVEDTFLQEAL